METNLTIFNFENNNIRTQLDDNGEPLFVVKDICDVLGYENSRQAVQDNCNAKGVSARYTLTAGGTQLITFITEANVYRLIMRSKKPEAVKFQDWVVEEVLPALRRHGMYIMPNSKLIDKFLKEHPRVEGSVFKGLYYLPCNAVWREFGFDSPPPSFRECGAYDLYYIDVVGKNNFGKPIKETLFNCIILYELIKHAHKLIKKAHPYRHKKIIEYCNLAVYGEAKFLVDNA